ncbi:MAG: hypothetical protein O3A46_17210 [Candidatus Poribacteria bacterium]|nr:hypothetical protein [Candidatus Poribacteria bacterium]
MLEPIKRWFDSDEVIHYPSQPLHDDATYGGTPLRERKDGTDGVILVFDVFGFSAISGRFGEPRGIIHALEQEIKRYLRHIEEWNYPHSPTLVPTGDGAFVALPTVGIDSTIAWVSVGLVYHVSCFFREWKWKFAKEPRYIRASLHCGQYRHRIDVNGNTNIEGEDITTGKRLIDACKGGCHFVLSGSALGWLKDYAPSYVGSNVPCESGCGFRSRFPDLGRSYRFISAGMNIPHDCNRPRWHESLCVHQIQSAGSTDQRVLIKHDQRIGAYNAYIKPILGQETLPDDIEYVDGSG